MTFQGEYRIIPRVRQRHIPLATPTSHITATVKRGLALLTDEDIQRIDLDWLNMGDCARCVLGQVYSDYSKGKYALGLTYVEAKSYGFDLDGMSPWTYDMLTQAWRRVIRRRLVRIQARDQQRAEEPFSD